MATVEMRETRKNGQPRHEAQARNSEHNAQIMRALFREIEDAVDDAEKGNAYRKVEIEIDVSAGKLETGRVRIGKTLK